MKCFDLNQLELVASSHEDTQVDGEHQQQGDQHTGKKVEVDHVVHVYHLLKHALNQAGVVGSRPVPAHHWGKTDDNG